MKKFFALLLALCMVFALCACGKAATAAPTTLTMGTGGESGTYYAVGNVLGNYVGPKTGISINVVASGGSAKNLTGMCVDKIYDLATVQSDVMTFAFNGTNSFAETGKLDGFRVLCGLYAETVQIVAVDPSIKSVADLKGKTVCVGDVGSGTAFSAVDILGIYGMTIDDITPVYQSFGASTESLRDGKIDAAFTTAGAPTPSIVDLATTNTVNLISIDDDHLAKLLDACPWYAAYTIPAGTYKGQDADAVTVTVKATLICRADLDDDVAYKIVSTIFNNTGDLAAQNAKCAEFSLEFATEGIAVPFAAGAAKYFSENGITVATAP